MAYEVQVCDWTQIKTESGMPYGVAVNYSVVYESENIGECKAIARHLKTAYNNGLREMMLAAQRNVRDCEIKNSSFISDNDVLVVTPEMQKESA